MSPDDVAKGHRIAGDMDCDDCYFNEFSASPQKYHQKFQQLIIQLEDEFSNVQQQKLKVNHQQISLMEVFCSPTVQPAN